ncbi:MAG: DUF6879 family protein [Streptosporangiaceae bacterium]
MPDRLDLPAIDAYFDVHFRASAFRLETLDRYDVETDGADIARYFAGEDAPNAAAKQPWLAIGPRTPSITEPTGWHEE